MKPINKYLPFLLLTLLIFTHINNVNAQEDIQLSGFVVRRRERVTNLEHDFIVKGRIVDELGNPVPDAELFLEGKDLETQGCVSEDHRTDIEGRFSIAERAIKTRWALHITKSPDSGEVIYVKGEDIEPNFNTPEFVAKKGEVIDLGDIKLQIRYRTIEFNFADEITNRIIVNGEKEDVELCLQNLVGDIVADKNLSVKRCLANNKNSLIMALPVGEWQITITFSGDPYTTKTPLIVKNIDPLQQFDLILKQDSAELAQHDKSAANKALARLGIDVNDSAFIKHLRKGNINAVKLLLAAGIDPNVKDKDSICALSIAIDLGYQRIVQILLENNANVNLRDNNGETPLNHAVLKSNEELTSLLIENGADIETLDKEGITPIMQSIWSGMDDCLNVLLAAGADVNTRDFESKDALIYATRNGNQTAALLLLNCGVNPNSKDNNGITTLMYAVEGDKPEIIDTLIVKGAELNAIDNYGFNALNYALIKNNPKIVQMLINAGMKKTPMMELIQAINDEDLNGIQKILFKNRININNRIFYGDDETPLLLALHRGNSAIVKFLISKGANVNLINL